MKKILSFAVAAAMLFTSCLMDETVATGSGEVKDEGLAKLTIKLTGTVAATRDGAAVETGADVSSTTFKSGWIFILDASNNVKDVAEVNSTAATDISSTGFEFPRLIPKTSRVFMLGNMPDEYDTPAEVYTLKTLDAIKAAFPNLYGTDGETHLDYTEAPIATTTKDTSVIEPVALQTQDVTDLIDYTDSGSDFVPDEVVLTMNLEPVISRIEIGAFKGLGSMVEFKVTGIFLSNYYPYYTFGGSYYDPAGTDAYDLVDIVDGTDGTTGAVSAIKTPGVGSDLTSASWDADDASSQVAAPTAGVWAVNVPAGTLPYIIVRMEEIVYDDGTDGGEETEVAGPKYLMINSYRYSDLTGGSPVVRPVTAMKANTIYKISQIGFNAYNIGLLSQNMNGNIIFDTGSYDEVGTGATVVKPGKTITLSGATEPGSVTVSPEGGDSSPIQPNTAVTITANNDTAAGNFVKWDISEADMEAAGISPFWLTNPSITFWMPNKDITITATWTPAIP